MRAATMLLAVSLGLAVLAHADVARAPARSLLFP